ncbi:hypothetical protein [Seinonella peptonophila]|uniref:hypothetical protein n=1 Tax=Seinonella peptonophila TaxID=112248 RepID=UPI0009329FC7|nr:hypothetical protein [Seinonella peptonophila]
MELEESAAAIMHYFTIQAVLHPNIIVTDELDVIVAEMKNYKLVFPEIQEIDFRDLRKLFI